MPHQLQLPVANTNHDALSTYLLWLIGFKTATLSHGLSMLSSSAALLSDCSHVFARLQALRLIARETLPMHQSLLVYDLLIFVAHEQSLGRKTMMKNVFMSLPHSASGIRRHLRKLLGARWLLIHVDPQDRRIRHLTLTEKGIRSLLNYAEHCTLVLDPHTST